MPCDATLGLTGFLANRFTERVRISLLAMLLVIVSTNSVAQTSARPNPQTQQSSNAQVTLNLQDVDIRVLINTVAEVSGKNFVVDPRVKGKVSVISGAPLDPDQLYDVFLSILEVHNFATVDSGSVTKVLPSNVIKQRPTPFGPSEDTNDAQITQIIQLKHAPVQDLVPIVRPLIPPTSHFAPHVASNSVVITDTAANIQRVLKIIKRIDVPDDRTNVRVVYLEKTKASELATTLTQIATANPDTKTAGAGSKVSIQPLDAINALVISATDNEFSKIQALIDELDIERKLEADISVIYLKHARAEDMVSVLNDLTSERGGQGGAGTTAAPTVQADEATNSIIVKATGSQLQTVRDVVDKLDIRREQVFVETVIAEVSLSQAADLGVNWGIGGGTTTGATAGTAAAADGTGGTAGTAGNTIGNLINRDKPGQILGTASSGTGFDLVSGGLNYILSDYTKYNLSVVVQALRADTNSNVLSTPTILTLDNEEAEIIVGQEVPFVTGRSSNNANNSSQIDQNGQVINNTIGNSFQTIERKDVGIKLKIKPQISDGDTIQLEVLQEISNVETQAIAGQADLITNRRSIEATVQVDDGQVIVLGGLIQDDVVDSVNRVPILGAIPILGALFRSTSKKAVKRNLMVFLKPRIIRSAEELAKYSKIRYDEVRRDGQVFRKGSNKFLMGDGDPAVLDKYDNVINDGILGTERRRKLAEGTEDGDLRPSGLRALIGKVRRYDKASNDDSYDANETQQTFETDGVLEDEKVLIDDEPIIWDKPKNDQQKIEAIEMQSGLSDVKQEISPAE